MGMATVGSLSSAALAAGGVYVVGVRAVNAAGLHATIVQAVGE